MKSALRREIRTDFICIANFIAIQKAIAAGMEPGKEYTITDLMDEIPVAMALSAVKLAAILKQMTDEKLERTEQNNKSYYRLK